MKTIEVLTENNISLTALVICEYCDGIPAKDGWVYHPKYICYAQNRLFHYYNVKGSWKMDIIAEYIVCPEWDSQLNLKRKDKYVSNHRRKKETTTK